MFLISSHLYVNGVNSEHFRQDNSFGPLVEHMQPCKRVSTSHGKCSFEQENIRFMFKQCLQIQVIHFNRTPLTPEAPTAPFSSHIDFVNQAQRICWREGAENSCKHSNNIPVLWEQKTQSLCSRTFSQQIRLPQCRYSILLQSICIYFKMIYFKCLLDKI